MPKITVILPVYNGSLFLQAAIESVLSQSFDDFELIVINDGSTDDSESIVSRVIDSRIRYFKQANQGLAATLNRAISLARGEFIARQDQDDISFPFRLEKQIGFLNANPDVGMVGTRAEIWVGDEKTNRVLKHPTENALIQFHLLFDNPFVHSSVMIRRSILEQVGGYCEDRTRQPPEDYELWSRVARECKVSNLSETLLVYREVVGSMSRTGVSPFINQLVNICAENIAWHTGRDVESREVIAISKLTHGVYYSIPRGVQFSKMTALVRDAGKSITQKMHLPESVLNHSIEKQIATLRHHYYQYRTGGWIERVLGKNIERYLKSAARRVFWRD